MNNFVRKLFIYPTLYPTMYPTIYPTLYPTLYPTTYSILISAQYYILLNLASNITLFKFRLKLNL